MRHKHMNLNYLQHQHELCGIPDEIAIRFYATHEEKAWAKETREKMGKTVIQWQLAGSSRMHKTYPYLDEIVARLMISYPDVDVVLTGGPECVELEAGWENEPRVHRTSGKWTMRQTLAFLDEADVIVGAETGVLNAACCLQTPKIVFLSHSTRNNLTRDWVNTVALSAPHVSCPGRGDNEAPACHMLHYTFEHCRKGEKKGVAVCMEEINPALTWEAVQQAILTGKARKPKLLAA
jgi:ADP-heptose:LPS heptosyltransferase